MAQNKKNQLSELMKQAWVMVKRYGMSMAEAMKKAWTISKLRQAMKVGIVKFYYQKVSGEIREAWGTLKSEFLPSSEAQTTRKPCDTTVQYIDTEKGAWRCFKIANLVSVAYAVPTLV